MLGCPPPGPAGAARHPGSSAAAAEMAAARGSRPSSGLAARFAPRVLPPRALLVPAALGDPSLLVGDHAVGAASPSSGIAGGCGQVHELGAQRSTPPSGRTPCRSVPPHELAVEQHRTPRRARRRRLARRTEAIPPSPTAATRSPSLASPPAYRSRVSPCRTGRISSNGDTASRTVGPLAAFAAERACARPASRAARLHRRLGRHLVCERC